MSCPPFARVDFATSLCRDSRDLSREAPGAECDIIDFSPNGDVSGLNPALNSVGRRNLQDDNALFLSLLAGQIRSEYSDLIDFTPDSDETSLKRASANYLAKIAEQEAARAEVQESDDKSLNERTSQREETRSLIASMRRWLLEERSADQIAEFSPERSEESADFSNRSEEILWSRAKHEQTGKFAIQNFEPALQEDVRVSPHRMHLHVETLADGKRIETFDNGSMVNKDALGRVIEIFGKLGDSLFITYGAGGELETFTRTDARGRLHSNGKLSKNGVTVRDGDGRVKAMGESMTVDPWGCFYLHTKDGQYFCLDLVGGIHCERRRLINANGKVEFITSAFAHDGFRMLTLYASPDAEEANHKAQRHTTYRFYGRDGTAIEFFSDDHFRNLCPTRSLPPASFPVHSSWMQRRQAGSAWESVKEYLSRVS